MLRRSYYLLSDLPGRRAGGTGLGRARGRARQRRRQFGGGRIRRLGRRLGGRRRAATAVRGRPGRRAAARAGLSLRRQPRDVRADRQLQGRSGAPADDPGAARAHERRHRDAPAAAALVAGRVRWRPRCCCWRWPWRARARGWSLRALALAALGAALLDPRIVQEERQPRPDLALVVVDESPSQKVGDRASDDGSRARRSRGGARGRSMESRCGRSAPATTSREKRACSTPSNARPSTARDRRLAGVVIISDGQVHDVPAPGSAPWLNAPVHLLLTGGKDERDRRIVVEQAPAFGLVDQDVEITYRVEQTGAGVGSGCERVRVRMRIDGEEHGSTPGADRPIRERFRCPSATPDRRCWSSRSSPPPTRSRRSTIAPPSSSTAFASACACCSSPDSRIRASAPGATC